MVPEGYDGRLREKGLLEMNSQGAGNILSLPRDKRIH